MITKTMYNLHVYIEKNEVWYVVIHKQKYFDIVSSSNFFLSELEKIKSCIYRVKTGNAADEAVEVLASFACTAA